MTSSAGASIVGGMSRPRAWGVASGDKDVAFSNSSSKCDPSQSCPSSRVGHSTKKHLACRLGLWGTLRVAFFREPCRGVGAMKALQATCIVGAITFTGMIHQVGGNTPGATVPDAMPEAAVSAETPGAPALSAAGPEASAGPGRVLGAELGPVPGAGSGPSLMAQAEIGDDSIETNSVDFCHHDVAGPGPTTSNPALVMQDFRYLI